jgi:hypothetical protein
MPLTFPAWWARLRRGPFARVMQRDLDLLKAPSYDMSDTEQQKAIRRVEDLLRRLQPGAIDAGSREALTNLINSWAHQSIARLDGDRDERQAVGEILLGPALEELARRKARYDADCTRLLIAEEALRSSFEALTGKELSQLRPWLTPREAPSPLQSGLGPADLRHPWVLPAEPAQIPAPRKHAASGLAANGPAANGSAVNGSAAHDSQASNGDQAHGNDGDNGAAPSGRPFA